MIDQGRQGMGQPVTAPHRGGTHSSQIARGTGAITTETIESATMTTTAAAGKMRELGVEGTVAEDDFERNKKVKANYS